MSSRVKAYSYIRLSSERQLKGDGETRQVEMRDAFLREHNLELDDTLRDLGISAFDGSNRERGALSIFLRKVEAGEIQRGSYLLVESLDRLSRDHVLKALRVFLSIIEAGIVVATLGDGYIYSEERINENWSQLIISLTIMSRAHEESARKAQRLREAWIRKRGQSKTKLTAQCPKWLRLAHDRTQFEIVPERVAVVLRIFEELASGIGRDKIARRLNADGIGPWGGGREWHGGTVQKVTDSRAVLGYFQPRRIERNIQDGRRKLVRVPHGEEVAGYFPQIVPDALWQRARRVSENRRNPGRGNTGGRRGTIFSNLLTGLVFCDACGSPMNYRDRGPRSTPCLRCSGERNGSCDNVTRIVYTPLEQVILSWALSHDVKPLRHADQHSERLITAERRREDVAVAVER